MIGCSNAITALPHVVRACHAWQVVERHGRAFSEDAVVAAFRSLARAAAAGGGDAERLQQHQTFQTLLSE